MSWGVYDYPEPPAVTLEDIWRKHHRDLDEDDYDEYAEDFYEHFEEEDEEED